MYILTATKPTPCSNLEAEATRFAFHDRNACLAAMSAECAGQQGKFWEYHDRLFDNQGSLSRSAFLRFAEELGLDRERFVSCLESDETRRAVQSDVAEGDRLGITSTPTLFINRRSVRGALDSVSLERVDCKTRD